TPPGPVDIRITVPEGYNIREIASILQKKAGVDSSSFVMFAMNTPIAESLGVDKETQEGYLYPETYFIAERSRSLDVIRRMTAQFQEVFVDSLRTRAKTIGLTVNEVVTLASLIETEAANAGERPTVSQVFHLRLKLGYPLQANPTIQYILGEKRRVLAEDLDIESPYNTYLHKGLPPGPIASPGIASIRAALYPAATKYLYFVSDGDGSHIFSETLDEHNSAVAKYLRKRNGKTN
ncbi:MAG: endolytic transglycosylase MltG, partial [Candidatus Latescibacterota bacterium]